MRRTLFLITLLAFVCAYCSTRESKRFAHFGVNYNNERNRFCVPVVEKGMRLSLVNDSVLLYSFGVLDTTKPSHHYNKFVLFKDDQIVEEEDTFFLPTEKKNVSFFITMKYNYQSKARTITLQEHHWDDAFRTKSKSVDIDFASELLLQKGLKVCSGNR